jgi:NADH-quinone oxidoreductase subunit G
MWKTTVWMFGDEIQRVTGRKDVYHEVEEFICNSCRFDHRRLIGLLKDQENRQRPVINQNNYTRKNTCLLPKRES